MCMLICVEMYSIANIRIAAEGIHVWNPGFDVTPSHLIHAHITELGIIDHALYPTVDDVRMLDVHQFMTDVTVNTTDNNITAVAHVKPIKCPLTYKRLNEDQIVDYVLQNELLSDLVGLDFTATKGDNRILLHIREVGDGNLNFVYIITGPSGLNANTIVIKQALPYVRCVGEQWPLTLDRATFEAKALQIQYNLCPEYVPEVYLFDESKALIAMRFIEAPHIILRKVLMNEDLTSYTVYPAHVAMFMAKTLFGTSVLKLNAAELRSNITWWSKNSAMCALTEQVIFTDPYYSAQYNHFERISPELENTITQGIYHDIQLKIHINKLKRKFVTCTQALLHGDLHSGSIMVTSSSTYIIDPEFAFYGPIGFDIGLFIANMLLAYCSHIHSTDTSSNSSAAIILQSLKEFYDSFEKNFLNCWNEHHANVIKGVKSDECHVFTSTNDLQALQKEFLNEIWKDSLGKLCCYLSLKRVLKII